MGLLNAILGRAMPGGAISKPLMTALGTLVVGKVMHHGGNQGQAANGNAAQHGGLLGGMSGLLQKLQDAGHGDKAQSWVGDGQNKPIDPEHLHQAIGQENVSHAAKQAGMSEQDLLSQLSKALPGLVDKLTANGKVPDVQELASALEQQN